MRKLAAIMFTDIVGFTALMGEDESDAMGMLKKNRELQKPLIKKYNGTWLKELGDGTLSSFPSAVEALDCAIEILRLLKWDPKHNLRIGIHVGDVIFEGGDVFGSGVNVASRIESLAVPGGICVTEPVYDAVRNQAEIGTIDFGKQKLKNVDHEINVYAIKVEGLESPEAGAEPTKSSDPDMDEYLSKQKPKPFPWASRQNYVIFGISAVILVALILFSRFNPNKSSITDSGSIDSKSIAVIPFTTYSTEKEDLFFADGVHDDILTQLSKIRDLKVISRTSVVQYKNTTKTMRQIAEELNVVNILEGSVRRAGDQVRIVAQLINAVNDHHIWSETYDRDYADIFAIQSDVAQKIATALKATLTPEEKVYIEEKPTDNMEAYDYYLKGKYFWYSGISREANQKAVDMLETAAELDPDFTLAYAWASIVHSTLYGIAGWDNTPARKELAKIALDKALALDPDHPNVHIAKGFYQEYCLKDYPSALREYEIVINREPNNSEIALAIGTIYWKLGHWMKAEEDLLKAYELDPVSGFTAFHVAWFYRHQRQFEKARHYYDLAIPPDPDETEYYFQQAYNHLDGFGDIEKARSFLNEAEMIVPGELISSVQFGTEIYARDFSKALSYAKDHKKIYSGTMYVGRAYYLLGEDSLAQEEFESIRAYHEKKVKEELESASSHSNLGQVYAYLGLKEKAIAEGQEGADLLPVSKDHWHGPDRESDLAIIYLLTGEYELALDKLEYLLSIPGSLTSWKLRLDPVYDPLRDNPRFHALVNDEYGE